MTAKKENNIKKKPTSTKSRLVGFDVASMLSPSTPFHEPAQQRHSLSEVVEQGRGEPKAQVESKPTINNSNNSLNNTEDGSGGAQTAKESREAINQATAIKDLAEADPTTNNKQNISATTNPIPQIEENQKAGKTATAPNKRKVETQQLPKPKEKASKEDNANNTPSSEAIPIIPSGSENKSKTSTKDIKNTLKSSEIKNYEDYFFASFTIAGTPHQNTPIDQDILNKFKAIAKQRKCTIMSLVNNILTDWKTNYAKEINEDLQKLMQ